MKRSLLTKSLPVVLAALLGIASAHASVTLNSATFPDATFRAAVAAAAGVSEGSTISESALTSLDVSNMGITSLRGLGYLTGLTYLDISGNSSLTTGADITELTALKTLKASNCNIRTLAQATVTVSGTVYAGLTFGSGNSSITYLDLSNNANFYTSGNLQYLTKLETLLLNNCTNFDYWGNAPGIAMTSLKWVDVSNCTAMDRVFLPKASNLQHLNASGTKIVGFKTGASTTTTTASYIVLPTGQKSLQYLNLSNCAVTNEGLNDLTSYVTTSLDTLIISNNSEFGHSTAFAKLSSLKYLDISGCDIYFREGSSSAYYLLHYLTPANNPNLETLLVKGSNLGTNTTGITGFTKLKTVDVSSNSGVTQFWVNGSPLLESLDITGDTKLTSLQLNNDALPRGNFTLTGAAGCTALQSLYLNGNNYSSVGAATGDFADIATLKFLYLENNSGFTGGALTMTAADCGNLTGIDLGNNGFTSFHAPALPSTLTALMLGDNPGMTRLEMHNNPGITTMTSSATMSDGSGLYLLGNTALTYMDISGDSTQCNWFQRIGNNNSLAGLPIDTIKAAYNKFYTFRNLKAVGGNVREHWSAAKGYYVTSGTGQASGYTYNAYWPAMAACPDSASVEELTALRYLDLSHNQLKDSVYLHKNTELRYLDVSHNRTIKRSTTSVNKGAAYRAWAADGTTEKRSFPDYKKYLWLANTNKTDYQEAFDQEYYTKDYNDTTGLYILDLLDNNKLEYLDISYTGIQHTALTHCHVALARYVWIQDLPNLKYFYANYNGMRSLGVSTKYGKKYQRGLESLERLSAIGMRGADKDIMMGSINVHGEVCTKLHYVNLAYSDYDSIGVGLTPALDTLIITGNPIHYLNLQSNDEITYVDATRCAFKTRGYDPETGNTVMMPYSICRNGARAGGSYTGAVQSPFSGLRAVRAYNRPKLTTLLLDSCNALTEVYAHHNPVLPKIHGFENLAYPKPAVDAKFNYPTDVDSLRLVWVNDNAVFNELNLTKNVNLQYLHAQNDKTLGNTLGSAGMQLAENTILKTAWVSNSRLQAFANNAGANLDTLKIWTNPQLAHLDVTRNTGLKWFDLRNCRVRTLDMSKCGALTYFDCSNDSVQGMVDNAWGYPIPAAVPTSVNEDGKNSIADLHFASRALVSVKADNNDLFCMDGLNNNPSLLTLSYKYNHVNAIDLSGTNPTTYDNTHNGRGTFYGELSQWQEKGANNETVDASLYYLQLDPDAHDGLNGNDTFLGNKAGQDTILSITADRVLSIDGFDADKVKAFTVNSSGPHNGTRAASGAPRLAGKTYGSDATPDPSKIIGSMAFLDKYETDFPEGYEDRYYIEYEYLDGRTATSTSTFYLVWKAPSIPTDVEETVEDGLAEGDVVSERYFDIAGNELAEPADNGVTIIVRQLSDGTQQTVKVMK